MILTTVCVAAGALDVGEPVGAEECDGLDVGVVCGALDVGVVCEALDELVPLLMYDVYDGDCAEAKLQPKKANSLCSVKLEATSEGSSTGVSVEAT